MSTPPDLGQSGEPLPLGEKVLRMSPSMDGFATSGDFLLSTEDKESPLLSLSVWMCSHTTPEQGRELMGPNRANYNYALCLLVDDVRQIRPDKAVGDPGPSVVPQLDVVWDPRLIEETGEREIANGASGHAGITNLKTPPYVSRNYYKSIRTQLVTLANKEVIPLPPLIAHEVDQNRITSD